MAPEHVFDLKCVRTLRSIEVTEWTGRAELAHWCEWNHPNEMPTGLTYHVNSAMDAHWGRFIRPGSVCIDIGAHSGDTCVPLGLLSFDKTANRKGRVVAVEPNPHVFEVLKINLALNSHICNYLPIQAAITAETMAAVELSDHGSSNCNTGIISESFSGPLKEGLEEVKLNTFTAAGLSMSDLMNKHMTRGDVLNLSFIKIDCEGYDREILRSAKEILTVVRPTLFVEWFAMFGREDSEDLFKAISEIGYTPLDPATLEPATVEMRLSDLVLVPQGG
jgi:FkbM family methyltransferase